MNYILYKKMNGGEIANRFDVDNSVIYRFLKKYDINIRRQPHSPVEIICLNCGKSKIVPYAEIKKGGGKFCSHACDIEYKTLMNPEQKKIRRLLHDRISKAIKKGYKKTIAMELLGCDIDYATKYIFSQFTGDMTITDFMDGKMDLHHRLECATFDLTDIEEQKKCFNIYNIQPLYSDIHSKYRRKIHRNIFEN